MPLTTIKIQTETRDRLADLGKKSESYDTILNRLIDFYQEHSKNKWVRGLPRTYPSFVGEHPNFEMVESGPSAGSDWPFFSGSEAI